MEKSRVTLRDVADLAGVSHQTVSRVINNSDRVRPETRAKVVSAISELGYRPNVIARSMVWGKTHTLGCISPDLTNYVFSKIIESAQAEARRQGFFILTGSAPALDQVRPLLDELLNRQVDGLMVLNPRDDDRFRLLEPLTQKGLPIVYLKNTPGDDRVSSVTCNDQKGGYQATKYLIDLGHTSIATILGPVNEECTSDRLKGYQKALAEIQVTPDKQFLIHGDWTAQSGLEAVEKILTVRPRVSAVFAQNDRMAIGAIRGLREAGLRVPEDISVIGYDDIPLTSYFDPPLTTIRQPLDQIGKIGAQLLIDAVRHESYSPKTVKTEPNLVERSTCAPLITL